jgi:2-dehydro-3-deoxyphosphogluconate aldolase/(4S)-4-hydroxy-2-oxoglutarate aldolase
VVAIVRLPVRPPHELLEVLARAGVPAVEITTGTPEVFETVRAWRGQSAVRVGVGTVRTADHVARAAAAGAEFLVSPGLNGAVLDAALDAGLPLICGAATPTEIDQAWSRGAAAVKVFPVDCLGGAAYVRAIQAPLPDVPLFPTGGVGAEQARQYAELGCAGVGVGSAVVDAGPVEAGDWDEVGRRAAAVVAAWDRGSACR